MRVFWLSSGNNNGPFLAVVVAFGGCFRVAAEPAGSVGRDGKPPARELKGLPLVFFDNFDSPDADRWEQSDPEAWKITDQRGNRIYSQFRQSQVQTPVRSPFNRALIKNLLVGDV